MAPQFFTDTSTQNAKPAASLLKGDLYPHPLDASRPPLVVDRVEVTTSKKWMTDTPIVAIYFVNGPKVVKRVEVAGDQIVKL